MLAWHRCHPHGQLRVYTGGCSPGPSVAAETAQSHRQAFAGLSPGVPVISVMDTGMAVAAATQGTWRVRTAMAVPSLQVLVSPDCDLRGQRWATAPADTDQLSLGRPWRTRKSPAQ